MPRVPYAHARHFLAVRDMLIETYSAYPVAFNWRLERWQYARSYVVPMIACYGNDVFSLPQVEQALATWDTLQGIWEGAEGRIAAAVATEYAKPSDGFILRRPGTEPLFAEMLAYIADELVDPDTKTAATWICDMDHALSEAARTAGFVLQEAQVDTQSVFDLAKEIPAPDLPAGWHIASMDVMPDIDKRREVMARGFNHADPREWGSDWAYRSLMQAPDYRPDLDLFAVGPEGQYAASAVVWYDATNRIASLEPVATHPDFRRRGLGREVIYEGLRRARALGATSVWVGSHQPFYLAIGFQPRFMHHRWVKQMPSKAKS